MTDEGEGEGEGLGPGASGLGQNPESDPTPPVPLHLPDPAAGLVPGPDPDSPFAPIPFDSAPPPPLPPRFDDDDDESDDDPTIRAPSHVRIIILSVVFIVVCIIVGTFIFLGRANAERYMISCSTDHAAAEQGRTFPPWGSHALTGPEWRPIALPANAECRARETDDPDELAHWYLDILIDRASTTLSARDLLDGLPSPTATPDKTAAPSSLDVAQAELEQALLLARAPERRDERKEIERLEGDVSYWRAALHLRDANAALADAAKQFDAAAAQRPRHATDAAAWATFLRRVVDELHAGPGGTPAPDKPQPQVPVEPGHTPAPPGTALPVEPLPDHDASPPPPDAGVPGGGVLL